MSSKNSIIALGKFDGLHRGHVKLISRAVETASELGGEAIVYAIGMPSKNVITNNAEKEKMLKDMGIHRVIFRILDEKLKSMQPGEFVQKILLENLSATHVVVGENFRFGKDRCADSKDLKELCAKAGIQAEIVDTVYGPAYRGDEEPVNSTSIRRYLLEGRVNFASSHLGRWYSIKGKVVEGKHLGTKLGFPTLNIIPDESTLVPKHGVYATKVKVSQNIYDGITNVGTNPTVDYEETVKIETHIFDANVNCYGSEAEIYFVEFIREEKSFNSLEDLASRVEKDKLQALDILKKAGAQYRL